MVRKKKKMKAEHSDLGTAEAKQHGYFVLEETMVAGVKRARNLSVDPVETMYRRDQITLMQYNAASRFAAMYRKAMLADTYATVRFGHIPSSTTLEAHEAITRAKAEVRSVLAYVGYPLSSLLEHTVGNSRSIAGWRKAKSIRSGADILRLALDGVAAYYKM